MSFLFLILSLLVTADDWPQFRGPTGQGVSEERGLPLTWSENKNVRWKVAIPGRGWSSPVVHGDRVWLTTATGEGKSLRAIAIDRNTGSLLLNVEIFRLKATKLTNAKNSFASPTPVVDGDRVYLQFGAFGTSFEISSCNSRVSAGLRLYCCPRVANQLKYMPKPMNSRAWSIVISVPNA